MKLYSWNVNGIRAVWNKGEFQKFIKKHQPDILCLQETKAKHDQSEVDLPEYQEFWNSADKKCYSGTAIFSKIKPLQVVNGLPQDVIDKYKVTGDVYGDPNKEGRVIAAEFKDFWLVTVYTPNAKDDLSRVELRHKHWDPAFLAYCKQLETRGLQLDAAQGGKEEQVSRTGSTVNERETPADTAMRQKSQRVSGSAAKQDGLVQGSGKPVIFCGDLNVAHTEDDLARPGPNVGKKGFTNEERAGFQSFIDAGFVDTFRMFVKGNGHYTWWTHWANARARNVGWRIDYFLVSESLKSKVKKAEIHADQMGSDHCPISIELS